MSRNLQSQTKLTEFAPLSPEVEDGSGFSYLFSKFFKRSQAIAEGDKSPAEAASPKPLIPESQWSENNYREQLPEEQSDLGGEFQLDVSEGRSLPNVLKRISNLLALKNTGRRSYNDTELKQYWMPDSVSKECYDCGERFTTFRRRHHCRVCGQIFCAKCCNQEIPGKIMNCTGAIQDFMLKGDLRVCMYCGKVVLSYVQSADIGADLSADLRALHDDLQVKFGDAAQSTLSPVAPTLPPPQSGDRDDKRKTSVGYQEERFGFARSDGVGGSLRGVVEEALGSGVTGSHRHRLRTYHASFQASQLIDWLISHNKAANRIQGLAVGQAMLESGYIEGVEGGTEFLDGPSLFRFTLTDSLPEEQLKHDSSADSESELLTAEINVPASNSIFNLNLNMEDKTAHLSKPPPPLPLDHEKINAVSSGGSDESGVKAAVDALPDIEKSQLQTVQWHSVPHLHLSPSQLSAYTTLRSAFDQHCSSYLRQLLNTEGVSQNWADVLSNLAQQVVDTVRPDYSRRDEMDIRQYVQFKKVSGGFREDCEIINGVVFSKNVVHRAMPSHIHEPKILLLSCAIVYQRVEGKFLSLEPVIMQEQDYIGHAVARIAALNPDLVLVGRGVSRLAQESLRELGISLALNVKSSVLERISRVTSADILSSVDAHVGRPRLGTCQTFHLRSFNTDNGCRKTLMVLSGCPQPELGCTVLLRGGGVSELAKIKRVANSLVFAYYNARLELSYLMDARASPPSPLRDNFFDDSGESKKYESLDDSYTMEVEQSVNRESESEYNKKEEPCSDSVLQEPILGTRTEILKENDLKINVKERFHEERAKVSAEEVSDFSDPLRQYLDLDDEIVTDSGGTGQALSVAELPLCSKFRKALEDNILSVSPYLKFTLPYLESEAGRHCPLRSYFGKKIYWSDQLCEEATKARTSSETVPLENRFQDVKLLPEHEFVRAHLTEPADSQLVKTLVAEYRACGGRLPLPGEKSLRRPLPPPPLIKSMDVLDPANHQHLPVLFCSYSPLSHNAPAFCVDPWIVDMELYGRNDIPLGAFLERYCFRGDYLCPSGSCDMPMTRHTRRFVHDGGALHVVLRHVEASFRDDRILMWNWCSHCNTVSPIVAMSSGTWSLSFAKYLELRFHGDMYTVQEACNHSLHQDYTHYFAYKHIVASFTYSNISVWEISLPPLVLETEREAFSQTAVLDEVKTWSLLGHQVFSAALTKLCSYPNTDPGIILFKQQLQKDQAHFKAHVEDVQAVVASSKEDENKSEEIIRRMWNIEDLVVMLKREVADAVEEWNLRLGEAEARHKKEEKRRSAQPDLPAVIDGITEVPCEGTRDSPEPGGETAEEVDVDHRILDTDTEAEDCEGSHLANMDVKPQVSDKKTVKTILSQLLPIAPQSNYIQSPMSGSEHHGLPLGGVPVVVYEREPSSIIAYALASFGADSDQPSPSPLLKRRSDLGSKETSGESTPPPEQKRVKVFSFLRTTSERSLSVRSSNEGPAFGSATTPDQGSEEEAKAKTQSPNIQFSDNNASFKVKVYFAEDFCRLRALVLPGGEESFVRSLTRCVPWAASGGKSGSNFSKTKDDRFILKEMSRIETQIFIDFAPQYFTYIETCVKTRSPTLLGKILGVYRVTYRNASTTCRSNLLVMEHLFHARLVTNKFDLKGSVRNRLVDTSLDSERETVLLDENLINMTCDSPLYVLPHSKTILMQAIHNDTQFLATQSVMDYSLLVGLDQSTKELVVGIIDYIRTFTWDKKLETMVKRYGLLGQGKQPTIISPDEYRERFIAAMHRYFLTVPDRWAGLGKGIDC